MTNKHRVDWTKPANTEQTVTEEQKEQFCWLGFYLWYLRSYWVAISRIPKADLTQQIWPLTTVSLHWLCLLSVLKTGNTFTVLISAHDKDERSNERKTEPEQTSAANEPLPWKPFRWSAILPAGFRQVNGCFAIWNRSQTLSIHHNWTNNLRPK